MNVAPNESGRNIWRKSFMSMSGKIASFIMSLVLIGWKVIAVGKTWSKVVDTTTGRTGYVANAYVTR